MFSKCLSNEVIGRNIRVNCINPGLVLTPDWKKTRQLTAGTQVTWKQYLDGIVKDNAPIGGSPAPKKGGLFCVPVFAACQLLGRLNLLCGWRQVEGAG